MNTTIFPQPRTAYIAKMLVTHFMDKHMCTLRDTKDEGIFRILSKRRKIKLNESRVKTTFETVFFLPSASPPPFSLPRETSHSRSTFT